MRILDTKTLFASDGTDADLASKSVSSGITTLTSQVVQLVLRSAGTMALARLLAPSDFGLIGMVTVIINFAAMFKDAGLSMATVQKKDISHEQISTLFWINVLISGGLGICVLISAPLIASFYGKPELSAVTVALSFSFIISGLTIQHKALQRRHMRFGAIAIAQISSQLVTLIVAVILALNGWRYWAIVGGTIASILVSAVLTFVFCPWIPSRMQRGTGVREMLKFGGHLTGYNFINYFSRNADNVLIGRYIGADALGMYSKAYNLFLLPISQIRAPINNVAIPALCKLRDDEKRYSSYYSTIIFLIATLNMPLVALMIVYAESIISVMLGSQWIGAVFVFQILAVVGLLQSTIQAGRGLPLMSMGFAKRYFHFGLIQSTFTVIGIVVGLHWGITGVAIGYGIAFYLLVPFTLGWCLKGSPVSVLNWVKAVAGPLAGTLVMSLGMYWIKSLLIQRGDIFELSLYENLKVILFGGSFGALLYIVVVLSLPISRRYAINVFVQIRSITRKRIAEVKKTKTNVSKEGD